MPISESSYARMIIATIIVIIFVAVAIITYSIAVIPLEFTIDALQTSYTNVSDKLGFTNTAEVNNTMGLFPWFLAAALIFSIALIFVWYFVYAHKMEYE